MGHGPNDRSAGGMQLTVMRRGLSSFTGKCIAVTDTTEFGVGVMVKVCEVVVEGGLHVFLWRGQS